MKNISRRVFIKGMAVAAAATAASTVLAGCNIVPGKDEPVEVPGFKPETKTLTNGDDTFTITAEKIGVTAANFFAVKMTMVNDLPYEVYIRDANAQSLVVTAYYDGQVASKATALHTGSYNDNLYGKTQAVKANDKASTYKTEGSFYVNLANAPEDWKTLTLNFVLYNKDGSKAVSETAFTFNK